MPLEQRPDREKPWFLIASLATITFFAVACLLVRNATAPVSATPPAAGSSYRAGDEQVSSNAPEAERTPAETPREAAAPQQAEQTPRERVAPQRAEPTPEEPRAPDQNPD